MKFLIYIVNCFPELFPLHYNFKFLFLQFVDFLFLLLLSATGVLLCSFGGVLFGFFFFYISHVSLLICLFGGTITSFKFYSGFGRGRLSPAFGALYSG